ncbi:MAG TPA: tetratricopeptide repeat protein [Thermoanaerobaculia bacterium]
MSVSSAAGDPTPVDQGLFLLHLNRARRAVRGGSYDVAWRELEQARGLRPRDEDVLSLVSVLEFKRGNYTEAAKAAETLVEDNPSSEILRANLGLILFKSGRLPEAERALQQAIDLRPGHLRSHLYLGLLYQMRGKLGLALEHLRIAGARRRVLEIEEALRKSARESVSRTAALSDTTPTLSSGSGGDTTKPTLETKEKDRTTKTGYEPAFPELGEATAPQTPRATGNEVRPLFKVRPEGGLEVASRGVVFVRKGCVTWYSGKMRFAPEPGFQGTSLERILRATGVGSLLVHDPGRRAYRRELNGQTIFVEGSRLLALDHGLTFRLEAIHDFRRNRRVDILRVQGRGSIVFSVGGPVLSHEVSRDYPLSISSRDLVAWTGELVAAVLDDQYLEEVMQPDVASPPKIRFEGEGTVLTEPPRPRRRAADMDRPVDQRRS